MAKQRQDEDGDTADAKGRLYKAPALEKGLDILQLLASEAKPMTFSAIVLRLGRSTGELFRMIQVLEQRGFIAQGPDGEGYALTSKLFAMSVDRPPIRNLVEIALPVMRRLSNDSGQSCHLALHSHGEIVIVARMESNELLGFTVRLGYKQPLPKTLSGAVLYAFQPDEIRELWESYFNPPLEGEMLQQFREHCAKIRSQGEARAPSSFSDGITDVSAPIMRGNLAAAALTVPFVKSPLLTMPLKDVIKRVRAAADEISSALFQGDGRA
ncbi:IclR family transcriptional regulator [Caulobacter sp. DWP3-1-3b2]|uniref:IclR family transcriptional regulator n=1 Tax=Caulobacter sp. DWP3-1-3b2 TaxID=2804643 RepID=UPI003CFAC8EF